MLVPAIVIFAAAAVGGLYLASKVLSGKLAPWPVGLLHAALGATGLVLLILGVIANPENTRMLTALIILVIAALGGFYLLSLHVRKVVAPPAIVIIHAGVAVIGFLTLLSLLF